MVSENKYLAFIKLEEMYVYTRGREFEIGNIASVTESENPTKKSTYSMIEFLMWRRTDVTI